VVEIPDHEGKFRCRETWPSGIQILFSLFFIGNRPTQIAMNQHRKDHHDALVGYGARPASLDTATTDDDNDVPEDHMDVEQIPLSTVEMDAEAERVLNHAKRRSRFNQQQTTTRLSSTPTRSWRRLAR
jgi:hypothetical protein